MRKLSEITSDLYRIIEIVNLYENDISKKTCNNCKLKSQECAYLPRWGEPVRYNCPFWAKAEEV